MGYKANRLRIRKRKSGHLTWIVKHRPRGVQRIVTFRSAEVAAGALGAPAMRAAARRSLIKATPGNLPGHRRLGTTQQYARLSDHAAIEAVAEIGESIQNSISMPPDCRRSDGKTSRLLSPEVEDVF